MDRTLTDSIIRNIKYKFFKGKLSLPFRNVAETYWALGTVPLPTTSGVGNELPRPANIGQVLLAMAVFHFIYT